MPPVETPFKRAGFGLNAFSPTPALAVWTALSDMSISARLHMIRDIVFIIIYLHSNIFLSIELKYHVLICPDEAGIAGTFLTTSIHKFLFLILFYYF